MADENHPDNVKLQAPGGFKGPTESRKCTDVLFFLLIIMSWVAMTAAGIHGIENGDPWRLINGIDDEGNICGVQPDAVKDFKKLITATATGSGKYNDGDIVKICVKDCPDADGGADDHDGDSYYVTASKDYLNRCVLDEPLDGDSTEEDDLNGFEQVTADIWTAAGYIGGFGFGFATAIAFVYLLILRIPFMMAGLFWLSVLATFVMMVVVGAELISTAQDWDDEDPRLHTSTEVTLMKVMAGVFFVCSFLFVCLVIFLRSRIALAMGVVKEAARCVGSMPLLIMYPFFQALAVLAFMAVWLVYCLNLASMGDIVVTETGGVTHRTLELEKDTKYALLYMVFQFFWTTQFIVALGQIAIALAVAYWYFTIDKSTIGSSTVLKSVRDTLVYHTGTAAFGSLILAIIKTIRAILAYIQKQAEKTENKVVQGIMCCLQCCMWCLEKCMRFINENAYTQTALFSLSFCSAARRAFFLILRNMARIGAVTMVGAFTINIGRIFIAAVSAGVAFLAMQHNLQEELYGLVSPTIVTGILAYMVANVFMNILDMAVTTILQCFLADEEMNSGSGSMFARNELKSWVDQHGSGGLTE